MKQLHFTKMHGIGNDYIYFYQQEGLDFPALSIQLSQRHKGIGSDGLIHIFRNSQDSFVMEMYNSDGSRGSMCGNGIRCVGKYLYDQGHTQETSFSILTGAGLRHLTLHLGTDGKVQEVTVAMGQAEGFLTHKLEVAGRDMEGTFVSVGNPHFVVLCPEPGKIPLETWGPLLEKHPVFAPQGVNVEFYSPTEEGFTFRVWERGSGETQACGTGACACFAVGQRLGVLDPGPLTATLLGGTLKLWQEDSQIFLRGEAVEVFQGSVMISE